MRRCTQSIQLYNNWVVELIPFSFLFSAIKSSQQRNLFSFRFRWRPKTQKIVAKIHYDTMITFDRKLNPQMIWIKSFFGCFFFSWCRLRPHDATIRWKVKMCWTIRRNWIEKEKNKLNVWPNWCKRINSPQRILMNCVHLCSRLSDDCV